MPPPPIDLSAAAAHLRITSRAGCDLAPLDPTQPMTSSRCSPTSGPTSYTGSIACRDGELIVVWHSVMCQYVEREEWAAIEAALDGRPGGVRLSLEPAFDQHARMRLTVHDPAGAPANMLAVGDDHGLRIRWETD